MKIRLNLTLLFAMALLVTACGGNAAPQAAATEANPAVPATSASAPSAVSTAPLTQAAALPDSCMLMNGTAFGQTPGEVIPVTGAFTVELWVYDTGDGHDFAEYVSQGGDSSPFYLGTSPDTFEIRVGDAWGSTARNMPQHQWTHLAFTHTDGGTGTLYINGEAVATQRDLNFGKGGTPTRLGSQFGGASELFSGCLDDVKIFSIARSQSQVQADMDRNVPADDPDLVAYYDFNDTSNPNFAVPSSGDADLAFDISGTELVAITDVEGHVALSGMIGLSNCQDSTCGAYFQSGRSDLNSNYQQGYSWYATVWPMLSEPPVDSFQMGLASTWINPDLHTVENQVKDPLATLCGDFGSGWGLSRWILFQSIEGGLGYWSDTEFKSPMPKWRLNSTGNCYNTMEGSGPGGASGTPFSIRGEGLVQVSNHLLYPPDGLTFPMDTDGELLGTAWMALPLPQAGTDNGAQPTGAQAWTVFLNAANFQGPLAYWAPQYFSAASQKVTGLAGMGLDAQMGYMGGLASELGWIPMYENQASDGTTYSSIPQLHFPLDENGRTILGQDLLSYSNDAIASQFSAWLDGSGDLGPFQDAGTKKLSISASSSDKYYQDGDLLVGMDSQMKLSAFDSGQSFGFQWADAATAGEFPSYFEDQGSQRVPVSADQVPPETGLTQSSFANSSGANVSYEAPGSWNINELSVPGGTVTLSDGSTVTYVWFRFVDQPAIQALNLSQEELDALQSMAEKLHQAIGDGLQFMAPPSSGSLVSVDPALIVTPPAGMEAGYVPIVIEQTGLKVGPPLP